MAPSRSVPPSSGGVFGLIRVQLWLHPGPDLPEVVELTAVKVNDRGSWDRTVLGDPARLAALAGQTLVVDLGYYSHVAFRRLFDAGVHPVTRLSPQTTVAVEAAFHRVDLALDQLCTALGLSQAA